jgi:hypothetical protein
MLDCIHRLSRGTEKLSSAIFSCPAGTSAIGCQGIVGADVAEAHTAEHLRESWWRSVQFQRIGWDTWRSGSLADELRRIADSGERGMLADR